MEFKKAVNFILSDRPVMLVDDSVDVQDAFQILAEIHDFPLIIAGNGCVALEKIAELKNDPAVLFVDLTMPIMNGAELLRQIYSRQIVNSTPIVIFSAREKDMSLESGRSYTWLAKPFNLNDVMNIIIKARA
jgi:CheY-like chemotaxis protein